MEVKIPVFVLIFMVLGILLGDVTSINIPKFLILFAIYLMLIPVMMNLNFEELRFVFKENKILLLLTILTNFLIFPIISYIIYFIFKDFNLFVATLLLSFLPTGSMTLNFIFLSKGDIHFGAIVQIFSLLLGGLLVSILFPIIISSKVGFLEVVEKVIITIVIPLIIAQIIKKFVKVNKKIIKKISLVGMFMIVFLSGYIKSKFLLQLLISNPINMLGVLLFYMMSLIVSFFISRGNPTVFYCLFLKNISIALGLSIMLYPESVIYIVASYILQLPLASYFLKIFR